MIVGGQEAEGTLVEGLGVVRATMINTLVMVTTMQVRATMINTLVMVTTMQVKATMVNTMVMITTLQAIITKVSMDTSL